MTLPTLSWFNEKWDVSRRTSPHCNGRKGPEISLQLRLTTRSRRRRGNIGHPYWSSSLHRKPHVDHHKCKVEALNVLRLATEGECPNVIRLSKAKAALQRWLGPNIFWFIPNHATWKKGSRCIPLQNRIPQVKTSIKSTPAISSAHLSQLIIGPWAPGCA